MRTDLVAFSALFRGLRPKHALTHQLYSRHPPVWQSEQRGQLSGVLQQSAKVHFHIVELALDHPTRVLNFGRVRALKDSILRLALQSKLRLLSME